MKHLILFVCIIGLACSQPSVSRPKLYITTKSATGSGDTQKVSDSLSVVTDEYVEFVLYPTTDGKFGASRTLDEPKSMANFRFVFYYLSDEAKKDVFFQTPANFLNYLSERGYEMVTKENTRAGASYTFKKGE